MLLSCLTCSGDLDLDSLGGRLGASLGQVLGLLDGGCKECVYKGSLANARFTYTLPIA